MACNVTISNVFGSGSPLNKITVIGTVQECPSDIEGQTLEVVLSCRSFDDEQSIKRSANVDSVGNWTAIFLPPFTGCDCADQVFVKARCLTVEGCEAAPFSGTIKCEECPSLRFNSDDDVDLPVARVECDVDGSALVSIGFKFFNDTSLIIQPRINCGPGGTTVSSNTAFVTPNNEINVAGVCRYNPSITPVPAPFVEFVNVNGFNVLDCPPIPVPLPPLPDCENAACPVSVVLEVTNAEGEVFVVTPPNEVLCLRPGQYTVTVISPLPQSTTQYFWSSNNVLIQPPATEPSITVALGEGDSQILGVAIVLPNCPPLTGIATLNGCTIDCNVDMTLVLRDAQNNTIDLDQSCIQPGDYTLQVEGPVEPPWNFEWTKNGTISQGNTSSQFPFSIAPGEAVDFEVTASAPGCEDKSAQTSLSGCETGVPPGGDSRGCAALLISAIGLLIAGAILIITGICTATVAATISGGVLVAAGGVLLAIWFWRCRDTTSCDVMGKMRCFLFYSGATFVAIAILLTWFSGIACGIPAILSSIGWFGLQALLTDLMASKGCTIESCTF